MNQRPEPRPYSRREHWRQRLAITGRRYQEGWQVFSRNRIALLGIGLILVFATFPFIHSALRATLWQSKDSKGTQNNRGPAITRNCFSCNNWSFYNWKHRDPY